MYVVYKNGKSYGPFYSYEDALHLNREIAGWIYKIYSPTDRNKPTNHVWTYNEGWVGRPSPFRPDAVTIDWRDNRIEQLKHTVETQEQTIKNLNEEIEESKSTDDVLDPEFSGEPDPNLWEQESRRQWYVIKHVHYTVYDEGDGEEWQADIAWGPYPSRERAENVLNIQARRCAERGIRAKFTITEEIE